jgi:uncharacterized protein (DUF697 family)
MSEETENYLGVDTVEAKKELGEKFTVGEITREVGKEAIGYVSEKNKRKIIKVIASCLSGAVGISSVGGFVYAGERGILPVDSNGWDAQESYNEMAEIFRSFFGIEEQQKETNQQLTKMVKETRDEQEIKEFYPEMIKNRFLIGEENMPMWYVGELGPKDHCHIVSGIIVSEPIIGEPEGGSGIYSSREVIVPVAFQNPITKEFTIRNVSFPYMPIFSNTGVSYFEKFQFLDKKNGFVSTDKIHYNDSNYLQEDTTGMQMVERLKAGDQVAFGLTITRERFYNYLPEEEIKKIPSEIKEIPYFQRISRETVKNNKAIVEAMKNNEEIPELTLYTNQFFIGVKDLESIYPTSVEKKLTEVE